MRRATPPCVRNPPARMKNGIAMISNRSMPVKSFSATASTGTSVSVNMKISTVRPSAIETGIAVSSKLTSSKKMIAMRTLPGSVTTPNFAARQIMTSSTGVPMKIHAAVRLTGFGAGAAAIATGALLVRPGCGGSRRRNFVSRNGDAFDLGSVGMRQMAGASKRPGDLQKTETHQETTAGNRGINERHRQFHVGRYLVGPSEFQNESSPECTDRPGEEGAA